MKERFSAFNNDGWDIVSSSRLRQACLVLALFLGAIGPAGLARSHDTPLPKRASFNANGSVNLPVGYRRWIHVGTRLKPIGINILDGLPTKTPEIFNTYIEPSAFAAFQATGQWPDGAQLVKEFSAVEVGAGCDAVTMLCATPLGSGIFETGFVGLGMMVKDATRFPEAKGNWGYFSFGHRPPPYESMAMKRPASTCEACHATLASDSDYVISRAHIGLARQSSEPQ